MDEPSDRPGILVAKKPQIDAAREHTLKLPFFRCRAPKGVAVGFNLNPCFISFHLISIHLPELPGVPCGGSSSKRRTAALAYTSQIFTNHHNTPIYITLDCQVMKARSVTSIARLELSDFHRGCIWIGFTVSPLQLVAKNFL